jgi:hypothetical protein
MLSTRILVCRALVSLSVLSAACAAQSSSGPTAQVPDAMATQPTSTDMPDARPAPSPSPDTGVAPSPPEPDAAPTTAVADAAPTPVMPPPDEGSASYTCTLIIGINATNEWYSQGFETLVDNAKWEIVRVHSGFVELWADPKNGVWNTGPSSACAQNANNPDRVLFVALNFDQTALDWWLPPLQAVVKNLQAKFSNLKRIELGTFVRAPGNMPCPQAPAKRSTIAPAEDQAIAMVAAMNPGLVIASPKFEAKTCGEFSGNPPHPSAAGGKAWAKMMADHYGGMK